MKKLFVLTILLTSLSLSLSAPFRNLDFEEANTNHLQGFDWAFGRYYVGTVEDLLPGWQVYDNTNLLAGIGYNFVSDYGPWFAGPTPGTSPVNYSIAFGLSDHHYVLTQRGDVPEDAFRLTFRSNPGLGLDVSMNGVPLRFILIMFSPTHNFDVSPFAGQKDVELRFTSSTDPGIRTFFPTATLDDIAFSSERVFVQCDFNGDDMPDVVFQHQDGSIGVWFMSRGPDLISASFFNPAAVADPRWHIVGTDDFNKDGKTDLLFQHDDGTLAVWFMDGVNLISAALLNPSQPGEGWNVAGTGDMNGDWKKDILFQHTDGTLAMWFMDGINLVEATLLNPDNPGDPGWRIVGTAALYGVGRETDLIFQHSDGTLAAWYMWQNGTSLFRAALLNPVAPGKEGWRVASTFDFNADGQTDLLFQHDDGRVAVWFMGGFYGSDLISGHLLNPESPGAGWRIVGPR